MEGKGVSVGVIRRAKERLAKQRNQTIKREGEGLFWVFKVGQALVRERGREVEDKAEEEELPKKKEKRELFRSVPEGHLGHSWERISFAPIGCSHLVSMF